MGVAPAWSIRAATAGDIADLQRIEVDAGGRFADIGFTSIARDDPPKADDLLAHVDSGTAWVAVHDDAVVGYAITSIVDGEAHLDQISVVESHGGQGIGKALVDQAEAWGRNAGLTTITLTTFVEVVWNGPWYERLGFTALAATDLGPGLRAIRKGETAAGIDVSPRVAMRKLL